MGTLAVMPGTSSSVGALANTMTKPKTKIVTRTVALAGAKTGKQETQQQTTLKYTERKNFTLVVSTPSLSGAK